MDTTAGVRTSLEHRIDTVSIEVALIRADFKKMDTRVQEIETTTKALVSDTSVLQQQVTRLQDQQKQMEMLLDDYEGRARRNNIRILGVPERTEGPTVDLYVEELVTKHLQPKRLSHYFSSERDHGVPGKQPRPRAPPRPIIASVFNFRDRDAILQAVRNGPPLKTDNGTITFFPDFTMKVQAQRRSFMAVKKALRDKEIKCSMQFPAKLRVALDGKVWFFQSPEEAWD